MTIDEFKKQYDPYYKCIAVYKDKDGFTDSGLILDDIQTSLKGINYININNFFLTVKIEDIKSINKTNHKWGNNG